LWYVGVFAAVLLAYSICASYLLLRDLRAQLVRFAIEDLETVEGLLYIDHEGALLFNDQYHNHPESRLVQERLMEVLTPEGEVLYRNDRLRPRFLDGAPSPGEGAGGYSARETVLSDGTRVQLVSRRHLIENRPILIRVAYSLEPLRRQFRSDFFSLAAPLPFILCAAGFVGFYLTGSALKPIREITRRAEEITSERLDARLPVDVTDTELGAMARVFNGMLSRLERSFEQLQRFTSDASHELRTPLTLMRSVGEVGLQTNKTPAEYRDTIGSMLEETAQLTHLVENLLTISRADAGQIVLEQSTFPAIDLARACGDVLDVLVEDKELTLRISGDEDISICGDRLLLRQALLNIVHNAIKHSASGGVVTISIERSSSQVVIAVTDNGPGITPDERLRVFDRFYRTEAGRSGGYRGAGLGLSIAQWTIQAHGGDIRIDSVEPHGCRFVIMLPAAGAAGLF
jgi:heavy metal sensor kinase